MENPDGIGRDAIEQHKKLLKTLDELDERWSKLHITGAGVSGHRNAGGFVIDQSSEEDSA